MSRLSALVLFAALLATRVSLAQSAATPESKSNPQAEVKSEELPANVDADRYARAAVVLRVKLLRPLGGESGVNWYQVKVLETLKNTVRQRFGPTLDVFTAGRIGPGIPRDPGVPVEECTIYIEPVVQKVEGKDVTHWRLLDGTSVSGVSHVAAAK